MNKLNFTIGDKNMRKIIFILTAILLTSNCYSSKFGFMDEIVEATVKKAGKNIDGISNFKLNKSSKSFDEIVSKMQFDDTFRKIPLDNVDDVLKKLDCVDDSAVKKMFLSIENPVHRKAAAALAETASDIVRRNGDDGLEIVKNMGTEGLMWHKLMPESSVTIEQMYKYSPKAQTLLNKTGEHGIKFFNKYVKPHPKKWIAGGVLVAFYSNPEYFIDKSGKVTEYAFQKFGEIGIETTKGTVRGIYKGFLTSPVGIFLFVVLFVVFINWFGGQFGLKKGWLFIWPTKLIYNRA